MRIFVNQLVIQIIGKNEAKLQKIVDFTTTIYIRCNNLGKMAEKITQQINQNINKQTAQKTNQQVKQNTNNQHLTITIASKKIQVNDFDHELLSDFKQKQENLSKVKIMKIQGNSYSKTFCETLGEKLKLMENIKDLNINDMFVARSKQQIPQSIQYISKGLIGKNLLKLDISNNAVNPFGAKALLHFLEQAQSLQVLLIYNCGLGPLGVAQIAKGLKGTPNLKTFSIGRNRMQNAGIQSIAQSIKFVPLLQQLFIYQNTLRKQGLTPLFVQLQKHCVNLQSFDLCDNFVREEATVQMCNIIMNSFNLRNLNLSDCLKQQENQQIVQAFQKTKNRNFERLGFNYIELDKDLALRLLEVLKECKNLKRLDITGNDFSKSTKKKFTEAFDGKDGVLSKFEDDDEEQVQRLFQELKI